MGPTILSSKNVKIHVSSSIPCQAPSVPIFSKNLKACSNSRSESYFLITIPQGKGRKGNCEGNVDKVEGLCVYPQMNVKANNEWSWKAIVTVEDKLNQNVLIKKIKNLCNRQIKTTALFQNREDLKRNWKQLSYGIKLFGFKMHQNSWKILQEMTLFVFCLNPDKVKKGTMKTLSISGFSWHKSTLFSFHLSFTY